MEQWKHGVAPKENYNASPRDKHAFNLEPSVCTYASENGSRCYTGTSVCSTVWGSGSNCENRNHPHQLNLTTIYQTTHQHQQGMCVVVIMVVYCCDNEVLPRCYNQLITTEDNMYTNISIWEMEGVNMGVEMEGVEMEGVEMEGVEWVYL